MKTEEKKEMLDRFRLYGEIWMLCVELFNDVFNVGEEGFMDYEVTAYEILDYLDKENFEVVVDSKGECPSHYHVEFDGIYFKDCMLYVNVKGEGHYYEQVPFMEIEAKSLQMILDVLTKFKEG